MGNQKIRYGTCENDYWLCEIHKKTISKIISCKCSACNLNILYEEQNLGEYGIGWMVIYENGIETSRHNIKHIETIQWDNALK